MYIEIDSDSIIQIETSDEWSSWITTLAKNMLNLLKKEIGYTFDFK